MAVPSVLCKLFLNSGTQVIVFPHFPRWLEPQACIPPHLVYCLYNTLYLDYSVDFPKAPRQGRWHSQVCQPAVTKVTDGLMEDQPHPFLSPCPFPSIPLIADSLHLPLISNRVLKKPGSQECSLPHDSRVSLVSGFLPSLPVSRAVCYRAVFHAASELSFQVFQ